MVPIKYWKAKIEMDAFINYLIYNATLQMDYTRLNHRKTKIDQI